MSIAACWMAQSPCCGGGDQQTVLTAGECAQVLTKNDHQMVIITFCAIIGRFGPGVAVASTQDAGMVTW